MQMPRTIAAADLLMKTNSLHCCFDRTTNWGVTASFMMLGDITIAEKGATIGFAARVIQDTIKELPIDFQKLNILKNMEW